MLPVAALNQSVQAVATIKDDMNGLMIIIEQLCPNTSAFKSRIYPKSELEVYKINALT